MTEPTKHPKRKRWLSFSLRTFLIVVIFLSAWMGWYVYQAERQRNVVRWIRENGGVVLYEHQFPNELDTNVVYLDNRNLPGPEWLHNIVSADYFSSVRTVHFMICNLPPLADLSPLATQTERF